MKQFVLWIIKLYWLAVPEHKRRNCLFRDSCSRYVYKTAQNKGGLQALRAFWFRYQNCRPGYQLINIEKQTFLVSAKQVVFQQMEIRENLILNT